MYGLANFELESKGLIGDGVHGLRHVRLQASHQFLGGSDDVVHPRSILQVAKFKTVFRKLNGEFTVGNQSIETATALFSFKIGCEGMRLKDGRHQFLAAKGHFPYP